MVRKVILLISILLLLLVLPLVSSIPKTNPQAFSEGYIIKVPQDNVLKVNTAYAFEFHVYNISDGTPITSGISCYFHLYGSDGEHITELENSTIAHTFDYGFDIPADNLSVIGNYYYNIQCNSTTLGGFDSEILYVSNSGIVLSTGNAIIYSILLMVGIGVFILLLVASIKIPWSHGRGEEGNFVSVNDLRYFKILAIGFTYLALLFLMFLMKELSYNSIIDSTTVQGFFNIAFWILLAGLLPTFTVFIFFTVVIFLTNTKLREQIERNLLIK